MKARTFEELDINIEGIKSSGKTTCPRCSSKRLKSDELCLSVNLEKGVYHCFHCGWSGGLASSNRTFLKEHFSKKDYVKPKYILEDWQLQDWTIKYFKDRGISKITLEANKIGSGEEYNNPQVISFPFIKGEEIVNIQYRTKDKKFKMYKGAEICFWGIHNLFEDEQLATKKLYITEGMVDALSLYEVGFKYVLSVPTGSPFEEEGSTALADPAMPFLNDPDISAILQSIDEVVFVTDDDYKGRRLREVLAERIGLEKSFKVEFPNGCKDANDVLVQYGQEELIKCVLNKAPLMVGLARVSDMEESLMNYYKNGLQGGMSTGLASFDEIYTLQEGYLTLITGTPEIGKSLFIDNLTKGYAENYGLHTAVFSPETKPAEFHVARLASIYNGLKFGTPEDADRMTYDEFKEAEKFVDKHYTFIRPKSNSLKEILSLAKLSVLQSGTQLLVIDPYSRIQIEGENEQNFIRSMLNEVSEFAAKHRVATWIVAHPTKMEAFGKATTADAVKDYPLVTPYHISGCYDEQTEYLGENGWKKHADYNGEKVAQFDVETGLIKYVIPDKLNVFDHSGDMYHYKTKNQDILVTPNHRMISKYQQNEYNLGWNIDEAKDLKSPRLFRYKGQIESPKDVQVMMLDNGYEMDNFLRYAGWYISEGHITMGSVSICQAKGKLAGEMSIAQSQLNLHVNENIRPSSVEGEQDMYTSRVYAKSNPEFAKFFIDNCGKGAPNKRIPDYFFRISNRQKEILLDALIEGDGSIGYNGHRKYHTTSKELAGQVQRLALECGFGSCMTYKPARDVKWLASYTIHISDRQRELVSMRNERHLTIEQYEGKVYCFTVPSGAYITRRNGRIAFQGNSASWYNSADFILSLWRTRRNKQAPTKVFCLKSKYPHLAKSFEHAELNYNAINSRLESTIEAEDEYSPDMSDLVMVDEAEEKKNEN